MDTRSIDRTAPAAGPENVHRGERIGRYVIGEEIGHGGMGVVFRAYDPELDRAVALKLLKVRAGDEGHARERLLREAQALAHLSHPNVVAVHDVGTFEENVFVAMELVEGQTVKQWLASAEPSTAQIVEVFVAAGRGLAAAHGAGLVHRDFKPANVIVGEDGRVRVLDFGLARGAHVDAAAPELAPGAAADSGSSGRGRLHSALTQAGAFMGTPPYMAPEQFDGGTADERSDQYSFCVSLHEAIYGRRPFTATTRSELSDKVRSGQRDPLPSDARAPRWLRSIIDRGLSVAPADRYPSMDLLLEHLSRDPHATRRRALYLGAAVLIGAVGLGIGLRSHENAAVCTGARAELAGVWDAGVKASIAKAFRASESPNADEALEYLERALDRRADAWVAMHTDACEATQVRGDQSAELMDLRMHCLDRRLGEMRAFTALLSEQADPEVVAQSVQAAFALPELSQCADAAALRQRTPPPADAGTRDAVREIRDQLAHALALQNAGKYDAGVEVAAAALARSRQHDYALVQAEALARYGWLLARTGKYDDAMAQLYEAAELAATSHDDHLFARVSADLAYILGSLKLRNDEADAMSRLAEAIIVRAGDDPAQRADLLVTQAFVAKGKGDRARARAALERALSLSETAFGADHPNVAHALNHLAYVDIADGKLDVARQRLERALEIWVEAFGATHPKVAVALNNLGQVAVEQGDLTAALERYERALAVYESNLGPSHSKVAIALNNMAEVIQKQGDCDAALPRFERARAIWEETVGPDHPYVAYALVGAARCALDGGRAADAALLLDRAVAIREAANASDAELAATRFVLARALWGRDRRRALALARGAEAALAAAGDDAASELAEVRAWLADRGK